MSAVSQRADSVKYNSRDLPMNFAKIDGASSGDNTLVAASPGNKIRVLSLFLSTATATTIQFQSAADGDMLTGVITTAQATPLVLPHNPLGWFETDAGELLNLSLGGAVQASGSMTYVLVPATP